MLNKLKARKSQLHGKAGFTLVELIVVLVILAILAALLIPALTGYIDKANEKKVVAETRQVVMAAQTMVSTAYGEGKLTDFSTAANLSESTSPKKSEVVSLAEVTASEVGDITITDDRVTSVTCTVGDKTCTYTWDSATGSGKYETH